MSFFYEFDDATVFATGAIGSPGSRTFYIQVGDTEQLLTVKCEKQQVAAIAQYLRNLLSDLPEVKAAAIGGSLVFAPDYHDFVLGTIGLGFDREGNRMIIQLEEIEIADADDEFMSDDAGVDETDDDDDDSDLGRLRVFVTPAQAAAFCAQAEMVVPAGRDACPWCGNPKDPTGHACPRMN